MQDRPHFCPSYDVAAWVKELQENHGAPGVKRKRCSATLGRVSASGWVVGRPVPRHQFVDALLRPAVDEACQQIGEIGLRIDAIEFAGLDQ